MPQTFCTSCNKPSIRTDEEGQVHYAICPRCPHYAVIRLTNSSTAQFTKQHVGLAANDNQPLDIVYPIFGKRVLAANEGGFK